MDISKMNEEDIILLGAKALLGHREMGEDELFEALKRFHRMYIDAALFQMVANGQLDMSWRDGSLWFSCPAPRK